MVEEMNAERWCREESRSASPSLCLLLFSLFSLILSRYCVDGEVYK